MRTLPRENRAGKPSPGAILDLDGPLATGLVSAFALLEGAGSAPFDARRGSSGSLGSTTWTPSPYGPAVTFTQTNAILNAGTWKFGGPIDANHLTLFALAFPTSFATLPMYLFSANGTTGCPFWRVQTQAAVPVLETDVPGTVVQSSSSSLTGYLNTWLSLAYIRRGNGGGQSQHEFYYNSILQPNIGAGQNPNTSFSDTSTQHNIGCYQAGTGPFRGAIACLYAWNRDLSAAELQQIHAEPFQFWKAQARRNLYWWLGGAIISGHAVSASDTATLSDSAAVALGATDSATLSEAIALGLQASDSAALSEQLAVALSSNDTATVSEVVSLAVAAAATDALSVTDAVTLAASIAGTDAATAAETGSPIAVLSDADAATLAEQIALGLASQDSTSLVEQMALALADQDSAALMEAAGIALGDADAATLIEAAAEQAAIAAAETVTLGEQAQVQVPGAPTAADIATLAEQVALAVAQTAQEAATLTESVLVALQSSEGGALAEQAAVALQTGDTATLADIASVSLAIAAQEMAALAETARVAAGVIPEIVYRVLARVWAYVVHARQWVFSSEGLMAGLNVIDTQLQVGGAETKTIGFDFTADLLPGEAPASPPQITAQLLSMPSETPYPAGLSGAPSLSGNIVSVTVSGLVAGDYVLLLTLTTNQGHTGQATLPIHCPM